MAMHSLLQAAQEMDEHFEAVAESYDIRPSQLRAFFVKKCIPDEVSSVVAAVAKLPSADDSGVQQQQASSLEETDRCSILSWSTRSKGGEAASAELEEATEVDVRQLKGGTVTATRPPPGTRGSGRVPLCTNLFAIHLPADTVLFRYNVTVVERGDGKKRDKDLCKGAANDAERSLKRQRCYDVYRQVVADHRDFFKKPFAAIYDSRNLFFSLSRLEIPDDGPKRFELMVNDCNYVMEFSETVPAKVDMSDFDGLLMKNLAHRDRSTQQLLELVTSQVIFYKRKHTTFGQAFYERQTPRKDLGSGKQLVDGFHKSVKVVEGEGPTPVSVVQVDLKKTAFFKKQPVLSWLKEFFRWPEIALLKKMSEADRELFQRQIKDLVVTTEHTGRSFSVYGLSKLRTCDIILALEDAKRRISRRLSLPDYFEQQYGTTVRYGNLPCLVERRGDEQSNFYPMELCHVADDQRVPIQKQTPEQMQLMIKESAIKPEARFAEIQKKMDEALLRSNHFLKALGMEVEAKEMAVEGRVLPQPRVVYENTNAVKPNELGIWDSKHFNYTFFEPGRCDLWACVCLDPKAPENTLLCFLEAFQKKAKGMGTQLGELLMTQNAIPEELDTVFRKAARHGVEFLMCIVPEKREQPLKDSIKLMEFRYEIVSQCVRTNVAKDACNNGKGTATLSNIVSKANMKLGGLNYSLDIDPPDVVHKWLSGEVLFCGCDVNHPPPLSAADRRNMRPPKEPSVVGFVGNSSKRPFLFTGDYSFQDPRKESVVDGMTPLMAEFLRRFQGRGGRLPKSVVLFRDGVSEGQFAMVLSDEVPRMRQAFAVIGGVDYKPKLTVVVAVKRHFTRLFLDDAVRPQSDAPVGTVVDTKITHPVSWEFFLKSHMAVQGTAKWTKYCVLLDENGLSQDEVQGISFALCYGHQIVTKTVSLPAPVYGAHEMAERGKRLWRALKAEEMSGTGSGTQGSSLAEDINWDDITLKLKTSGTKFDCIKHWA